MNYQTNFLSVVKHRFEEFFYRLFLLIRTDKATEKVHLRPAIILKVNQKQRRKSTEPMDFCMTTSSLTK